MCGQRESGEPRVQSDWGSCAALAHVYSHRLGLLGRTVDPETGGSETGRQWKRDMGQKLGVQGVGDESGRYVTAHCRANSGVPVLAVA